MRFRLRPVEILTRYERRTVQGRLEPIDHCHANGRNRRSAEARDSTDELPLTVRERLFVLRPPDGKVCPTADLRADASSGLVGWWKSTARFAENA